MSIDSSPTFDSHPILLTEVVQLGGAERSILALARWLHARSIPVHLIAYSDLPGLSRLAGYPLQVIELLPTMDPFHKVNALRRHFASRPRSPAPLTSGYQPALHATLAGLRGFHCLMHDTPSLLSDARRPRNLRQRLNRQVSDRIVAHGLRSGGQTIVTSEFLRADCRRTFGVEAQIVRMGGFGETCTSEVRPRPVTDTLRMLSVSRIEANKRIDWVLRALASLESRTPSLSSTVNWEFNVTGKGSQMAALSALAADLGLGSRVHFLGYVSDAQLQQLYDETHLFLMPAVQGYGIPAIESLQRGIPILLHRESGVSDILLGTPWATIMEGGEPSMLPALERAINTVLAGRHLVEPLPPLPTEDLWAERVATLCNWNKPA